MGVIWHGSVMMRQIHDEMERRIKTCCIIVRNHWRLLTSIDGTQRRKVSAKTKNGTRTLKKGALIYGANASKPGDPPHVQSGHLRRSEDYEVSNLIGRIGTNVKYLLYLEFGTKFMKARPSLRRALAEKRAEITAILTRPMKF